jgi:hypothetical protein
MHRAPQHEIPSVGEITKNLAKRVAVGFHRINFGKVLVNPQPHHRKPGEADADLFKEKGTKTSHRARRGNQTPLFIHPSRPGWKDSMKMPQLFLGIAQL